MNKFRMTPFKADLVLASATVFWGTTFIVTKLLLRDMTLFDYMTVRFFFAVLILGVMSLPRLRRLTRECLRAGVITGVILYATYILQTSGLLYTSAANTGLITGAYVIFVPLLCIVLYRKIPSVKSLLGLILAFAGLVTIAGPVRGALNPGDLLVLASAFAAALHITFTHEYSLKHDPLLFTFIVILTVFVLGLPFSIHAGLSPAVFRIAPLAVLFYLAVFGTVYAFLLQSYMQKYTTASHTALIFSLEPLFAAVFAVIIGGERLDAHVIFGGALIFGGIIAAESPLLDWFRSSGPTGK